MSKTVAERCVLVALLQERGAELLPYLDSFARSNQLTPEKSHPVVPRCLRLAGGVLKAEIAYRLGMGRFGAELALFLHDKTLGSDLPTAFDEFVTREIAPRFKVTHCTDVPGYQQPETYQ